jgi:hypothetical protein
LNTNRSSEFPYDIRAEVLASPAYRERCELLFELFRSSREIGKDPNQILIIQAGLAELLFSWQDKKKEFKQQSNKLGVAVVNRLIQLLKSIADSIVWRTLDYDRLLIQLLSQHGKTGHIDKTLLGDMEYANQIIENEGAIVFVNDLTSVLRYGDLTIINGNDISIAETKYGKSSKRSVRSIRQRRKLEDLIRFLNTGVRVSPDLREFIFKADIIPETYHASAEQAITEAKRTGYQRVDASDCVVIEAVGLENQLGSFPDERPFADVEHSTQQSNFSVFDKQASRIAPYGIFPLAHQLSYDLLVGNVFLGVTINFDHLKDRYAQVGLTLELPQPTEQEINTYMTASPAERKKLMHLYNFVVRDGDFYSKNTPDIFTGRLGLELLRENTLVQSDRQFMDFIKSVDMPVDKRTIFYNGYKSEKNIWV